MSCNCEAYACLEVLREYDNCREFLTVVLPSPVTGTIQWEYEFNGMWKGGNIDVTEGQNIVLPWVFNEYYVHDIKFYVNGELLNDTCYRLDTSKIPGSYATPATTESKSLNVTLTADMLSFDDEGNQVVTMPAIGSRTILLIADGNQIYNIASFSQSGTSFTMTNGAVFYAGQIITLLFA